MKVAAVVVAMLVAAAWWTSDHDAQIDLSAAHRFSLSADSRRILRDVTAPMHITAFVSSVSRSAADARFLLSRYHELNHHLTFQVTDPDVSPGLARRFGVTNYATVVVEYRGRRVDAADPEEAQLSTAMLEAIQGRPATVCALAGHGEDDTADTSPNGFSSVAALLKDNDYTLRSLDLTRTSAVPGDCAVVLVDGPRDPLLPGEVSALSAYARAGGRLGVLATPISNSDPNPLLAPWGIHFIGGLVVDPDHAVGTDLSNLDVESFPSLSPVGRGLSRLEVPAPGALATRSDLPNGLDVEAVAVTSGTSYVAPDPNAQLAFQPGDQTGPVPVVAAADASRVFSDHIQRTRVFATGSDLWATNRFLDVLSNRRLLVNALAWLTERNQLLVATDRPADTAALPFTAARQRTAVLVLVLLIPGAILAAGVGIGALRRR